MNLSDFFEVPEKLIQAAHYGRKEARQGYHERNLTTTSGDVTLHVLRLREVSFENAIIERYRSRESSVEEDSIDIYLVGVSVRWVKDITETRGQKCTSHYYQRAEQEYVYPH